MKKSKGKIIISIIVIVLCIGVISGLYIFNKIKEKENENYSPTLMDVGDVNNVPSVDSKLGDTMKITHSYLLSYTTKKASIWYMSSATIKKIKINDDEATITLINEDGSKSLTAIIDNDKVDVKKGDTINFVGTINLENGQIVLSKISKDLINYNSVTKIEFNELVDNIDKLFSNYFVVSGYMVTDGDKYKLYDSKSSYQKNSGVGNYFNLVWKDTFNYTGNANVTVMCMIGDTFKLIDCELME